MTTTDYGSRGTPVTITAVRVLDHEALLAMLGHLAEGVSGLSDGHVAEVASDEGASHEIITYHRCVEGHIVYHVGHKDFTTGMSVEDGTLVTTIPCPASSDAAAGSGPDPTAEIQGGGFLATVPPDLVDRVDPDASSFVVVTAATTETDSPTQPISTTWSTAACDGGHVVMHYGHEDPNTGTSVYDGAVSTTVPC